LVFRRLYELIAMCIEHRSGLARVASPELAEQTHSRNCERFQARTFAALALEPAARAPVGPASKTNLENRVISMEADAVPPSAMRGCHGHLAENLKRACPILAA